MEIIERSATDLAGAIRDGELTSREVVEAHVAHARRVNPELKAIAVDRFDAALAEADEADARVRAGGELPPFHGVPCTIKESFAVEGMPNAAGLVHRRDHRAEFDAPAVARLRAAGAIPIGVTNTSEATMWIESSNKLYGRTNNAYNPKRTAGGSSGGEGSSVGAGFAPIGLGSDIGGSIRLPAFFNGVFGHKPSPGVVPNSGSFPVPSGEGASAEMLASGPLARRAEDLMPFVRAVAGPDAGDPVSRVVELGDPASVSIEGLDVVVSEGATLLPVRGELREARERAVGVLAAAGANIRRERLTGMRRTVEYYLATLGDDDNDLLEVFALEVAPRLSKVALDSIRRRSPHTLPFAILFAAQRASERMPTAQTQRAIEAGKALTRELDEVIGDGVMLHPPFPRVAPRHGGTVGRPWVLANAAVFNLTGMPVTQVPLGLGTKGLPVGVQVVARRDRDHVTIAVAQELERALGGWVLPRPS
ncbi:MAG: fatty acid amide hydrolase 2 [Thermoleophilaceae bacterium]|jgi:fatty acid amide hydrolase 2|nr:fatty acid amide hydrolase 2 [Thermoleophilaceae bacterium]